jgi:hypothetical protein
MNFLIKNCICSDYTFDGWIILPMLHKLSKPILTERTIDTPYAQRSPHK